MTALYLTPDAEADIEEGASWYRSRRLGLDDLFLNAVDDCVASILQFPRGYQRIRGNIRQAPIKHWPYVVTYSERKDAVTVLRVFMAKQDPRKKFRKR